MYNKLIILILCLCTYAEMADAQLSKPILKEIAKLQNYKKDELGVGKRFNNTRKMLNESDSLFFIDQKMDTVFLLEMYDMETGISYGSIWNKCKILNYTYYNGSVLKFKSDDFFTKYMRRLVSAWDIDGIRKEDREDNKPISPSRVYATRIIMGKKNKVDMISFDVFFDFKRDTYDQYNLSN